MGFVKIPRRREKDFVDAVLANDMADQAARETEIAQRVRREVSRLRADAEAEGWAKAEAAFQSAGQTQGAAAIADALAALNEVWTQLNAPLAGKAHDLAELVIELSFVLARHILGIEVAADPASLQALVTRLIQEAAAEAGPKQSIIVRLNPADHATLAPLFRLADAQLRADPTITRGGALVEMSAADGDPIDRIEWDATIEARVEAMRTALALSAGSPAGAGPAAT